MGTDITDWAAVEGAYYTGIGAEGIWLGIAIIICIVAIVMGSRHELEAYKKLKK